MFWYKKNFFGDITAVYRGATKIAEYVYDAWGNCTVKADTNGYGSRNPFRYRGYYWDGDLAMYYLITRYYDPAVGRFISADSTEYLEPDAINGLNLYAYCGNNPVMNVDPWGTDVAETHVDGEYDLDEVMYNAGGHAGGAAYTAPSGGHGASARATKTEIHHVVEQSQIKKSGFSSSEIQAESNKVVLDYGVHRQISGYYSSKQEYTNGLRVRDWLTGQSFEYQTEFGWRIIRKFRGY